MEVRNIKIKGPTARKAPIIRKTWFIIRVKRLSSFFSFIVTQSPVFIQYFFTIICIMVITMMIRASTTEIAAP